MFSLIRIVSTAVLQEQLPFKLGLRIFPRAPRANEVTRVYLWARGLLRPPIMIPITAGKHHLRRAFPENVTGEQITGAGLTCVTCASGDLNWCLNIHQLLWQSYKSSRDFIQRVIFSSERRDDNMVPGGTSPEQPDPRRVKVSRDITSTSELKCPIRPRSLS